MNWLIVKNDLKRNKTINLSLFAFMMLSTALAVISVIVAVQMFSSISSFYDEAKPPHFLQMHKGDINFSEIDEFVSKYDGADYWNTSVMIDVYGEYISIEGHEKKYDLSDCRLDIGFVTQNESRDLLLDPAHNIVELKSGELGFPVILKEMYDVKIGDRVSLNYKGMKKEFVVKEFILDSMMNSTMCSSTRVLINDSDFKDLQGKIGENEYLVEVYFEDLKSSSEFQSYYENSDLPQNGQAITYNMIFLLSALTDIMAIFIMFMISISMIVVSFLCLRFTIMASLEEETAEIATMKAIGISFGDIRRIYLSKYRFLAALAAISGYAAALIMSGKFTNHITTTFGNMGISSSAILFSSFAGIMVFLLIDLYCRRILKKIKKLTIVDALTMGKGFEKGKILVSDGLHNSRKLSVNAALAIRETVYSFINWKVIYFVMIIVVMMILVPAGLLNTFKAPEFISYMGSSLEDILIEVENGEQLENNYEDVKKLLDSDTEVGEYNEYRRVLVQTLDAENRLANIHVDLGNNSGKGLKYLSGRAPEGNEEIALSYLNSEKIGKKEGEGIALSIDGLDKEFIISGIYQDVTSGGYTAKSQNPFAGIPSEKYSFSVNLKESKSVENKAKDWNERLGEGITADPMGDFIDQTLGGVVKQVSIVVLGIIIVSISISILISVLFLKLRIAKDSSEIAIMKAVGFSKDDIKKQYLIKMGSVAAAGIISGIILNSMLGEKIINGALSISGLGLKSVKLITDPVFQYLICPVSLIALILAAALIVMRSIRKYNIISIIKE